METIPAGKINRLVESSIKDPLDGGMDRDIHYLFLDGTLQRISYHPLNDIEDKWCYRKLIFTNDNCGNMPTASEVKEYASNLVDLLDVIPEEDWPQNISHMLGTHLEFRFYRELDNNEIERLVCTLGIISMDFDTCEKKCVKRYRVISR